MRPAGGIRQVASRVEFPWPSRRGDQADETGMDERRRQYDSAGTPKGSAVAPDPGAIWVFGWTPMQALRDSRLPASPRPAGGQETARRPPRNLARRTATGNVSPSRESRWRVGSEVGSFLPASRSGRGGFGPQAFLTGFRADALPAPHVLTIRCDQPRHFKGLMALQEPLQDENSGAFQFLWDSG